MGVLGVVMPLACDEAVEGIPAPECIEGRQVACVCPDGLMGAQTCSTEGAFGDCRCSGMPSTSGASGSSASSGSGGALPEGEKIASGDDVLIDVFVADAGIVVVSSRRVELVGRDGAVLQALVWPRDITAADLANDRVAIADEGKLTTLDLGLGMLVSVDLVASCDSGSIVKELFVCGHPLGDHAGSESFDSYDLTTGLRVAHADTFGAVGHRPRQVRDTGDIVSLTARDARVGQRYALSTVADDGGVSLVGSAPGGALVGDAFALIGVSGDEVVSADGSLHTVCAPGCELNGNQCFPKSGSLPTLGVTEYGPETYVGLDSDGAGEIYGLVGLIPGEVGYTRCYFGCRAQRVDATTGLVKQEKVYQLDAGRVVAVRHDAVSNTLVVGYRTVAEGVIDPYPGFRVALLAYE